MNVIDPLVYITHEVVLLQLHSNYIDGLPCIASLMACS